VSDFYRVTLQAPYWVGPELTTAMVGRPHGVFLAGATVELLRKATGPLVEPMALVTDGVLTGWVHECCLELAPVRPRSALDRLLGEDEL
jgi:hypothetical protein